MENDFYEHPILNSPYRYPARHWELDDQGQPTQQVIESRRGAEFITPIPKPRKRRAAKSQQQFVFDEGKGLSTEEQQYDVTALVNEIRRHVDQWRTLPNPDQWGVTPATARLLQHWRHHQFSDIQPFFCQVEAVETVIWLTVDFGQASPPTDERFVSISSGMEYTCAVTVEGTLVCWGSHSLTARPS